MSSRLKSSEEAAVMKTDSKKSAPGASFKRFLEIWDFPDEALHKLQAEGVTDMASYLEWMSRDKKDGELDYTQIMGGNLSSSGSREVSEESADHAMADFLDPKSRIDDDMLVSEVFEGYELLPPEYRTMTIGELWGALEREKKIADELFTHPEAVRRREMIGRMAGMVEDLYGEMFDEKSLRRARREIESIPAEAVEVRPKAKSIATRRGLLSRLLKAE